MDATIVLYLTLPLLVGWVADRLFGDPERWPHPIVWFGRWIALGEKRLNQGGNRTAKGAVFATTNTLAVLTISAIGLHFLREWNLWVAIGIASIGVFYCLAGQTLRREVKQVFDAAGRSTEQGRVQLSRIVGRDTRSLNDRQIRTAALETLAENLSDGVIAPLFWYLLLGVPGMLTYKMVNTMDSMIGYKNDRYRCFGRWAARLDDVANFVPARMTALLMLAVEGELFQRKNRNRPSATYPTGRSAWAFVQHYGPQHASPNAGYPESALAALLNCRFGGPNTYFGQTLKKPYIGEQERTLTYSDMERALKINLRTEQLFVVILLLSYFICLFYLLK